VAGPSAIEILGDGALIQVLQRQQLALPVQEQVLLHGSERVLAAPALHRPVGRQQHQPGSAGPPGEVGDQVKRRVVGPVQVLEPQHEQSLTAECLERLGHLA
jgi:hypothetical protein